MKLLEKHIEQAVVHFLTLDGWICRKMEQNYSERKRKVTGQSGMPDQLCIRYQKSPKYPGEAEVLWIELKRERGGVGKRALFTKAEKARINQRAWHATERSRGALVWLAGEDFPATIEGLMQHYRDSGLMRRSLR